MKIIISELHPSSPETLLDEMTDRELKMVKGGNWSNREYNQEDVSKLIQQIDAEINNRSITINDMTYNARQQLG